MRTPFEKQIVARFPGTCELRADAAALLWHGVLLGVFALLCVGVLSPGWFLLIGVCAYVRNFNALHGIAHARRSKGNPLRRLRRLVMTVHSPFQVGHAELSRAHHHHHAFTGDPQRDPHVAVCSGSWSSAALAACFAPEIMLVRHVRSEGRVSRALAAGLLYNAVMTAALVWFAGANIVWWIAATRLGSTAVWFIFDWILHRPRLWSGLQAYTPWPLFSLVWTVLFGRDNLNATVYHKLHHRFGHVADRELPALAQFLASQGLGADGLSSGPQGP